MRRRRRTAAAILAAGAALLAAAGWWATRASTTVALSQPSRSGGPASPLLLRRLTGPHLAPGSDPSVLPGPVLIADRANNRLLIVNPKGEIVWEFPRPGDMRPGESFRAADDAFFSPDGTGVIATQEDDFAISVIDVGKRRIVYRYGTVGVPGGGPNQLWNPDDAMLLPGGWILTADIKNCRLLLIRMGAHQPSRTFGTTTQACYHAPPSHWGSPNGAFPTQNGHFLVTEINGDWVDELTLSGRILDSWHPPGFTYPSDTNEVRPGLYLSVDYTNPGSVETFDRRGRLVWRYRPRPGDPQLDHPSLAEPLPNGDILLNDDDDNRVIVIDPRTNKVVWQYGHTGRPGSAPGYLNDPDGVDLAPPHSLLIRQRATIGRP
ncbi:MAG: hypothetical protein ACRDL2_03945 [Gaiellaceae bacterium]